ncbi:MAG: Flp pilus assembly protein CpaB [Proteobacteria bacterium]|nr:Flp pilus assembly protein CpaB [Pseudomonadota bacterium]
MRPSSIVMLTVALGLGVSAAMLSKIWLQSQVSQPQIAEAAPKLHMGTVVIAAKSLRFGNQLSQRSLRVVEWPTKAIPQGAFKKITDIVNGKDRRVVLSAIEENEPVLGWKITGPGQRASLSALIGEGKRAVTIRVNDVLGVAGFVLPGERVDILLTRNEAQDQDKGKKGLSRRISFTDVLLRNVRVLAVDQLADDRTEKPAPAKAITIEVDTLQAQKLVLAASVGQLALALRSAGSTDSGATRRVALSDLNSMSGPSDDTGSSVMVTVTRALVRSDYTVPRYGQVFSN